MKKNYEETLLFMDEDKDRKLIEVLRFKTFHLLTVMEKSGKEEIKEAEKDLEEFMSVMTQKGYSQEYVNNLVGVFTRQRIELPCIYTKVTR